MARQDQQVVANPISNPPAVQQGTPGYGNTRRDIGDLLFQSGGNLLAAGVAEYFDSPALGESVANLTTATTELMHQRLWKSEFENFQQTYGQQYQAAAQQVWAGYNELENSFGNKYDDQTMQARTQAMQDLMSKVQQLDVQFMQNAAKFGHNPLIGNMANGLMQQRSQWMQSMMGAHGQISMDAEENAKLQKAQFEVSPDMQDLTIQGKKADIGLKEAQTGEAKARSGLLGAQAESLKNEGGLGLPNVPAGKLNQWLVTDPKGKAMLDPYMKQAEARLRDRLIKTDPTLATNADAIELKVRMAAPQIRKEAVAAAMQDILPADAYSSILADNPRVSSELLSDETATTSPSIAQKYSKSELKHLVEGDKETPGIGKTLIIDTAEKVARTRSVKSIDELRKIIKDGIDKEVEGMVGDFEGSDQVRQQLAGEMLRYFDNNWESSGFLYDELGGGFSGKLSRLKKGAEKYGESLKGSGY